MPDMLVKLYRLPNLDAETASLASNGVIVRVALSLEKPVILDWVRTNFSGWSAEVEAAFARMPVSCLVALDRRQILGLACYDVTCRNFFGPMGVVESCRGLGIGKALLLAALHAQRAQGYAYSIIGGVGPAEFYEKVVGAILIEDSSPGVYDGVLTVS